jgi:hypothetical protein
MFSFDSESCVDRILDMVLGKSLLHQDHGAFERVLKSVYIG